MDAIQLFHQFFDACVGTWITERTYHYLASQEVERSHTEFTIQPLPPVRSPLTAGQVERRQVFDC